MLVTVLASGSKGNSTLIKTDKLNILIDAGMNFKYLKQKIKSDGSTRRIFYIQEHRLAYPDSVHRPRVTSG